MQERLQKKWLKSQPVLENLTYIWEFAVARSLDWRLSPECATLVLPVAFCRVPGPGGCLDNPKGMRILTGASLVMAVLQSVCTAVLTISGLRLAIGLTAFAVSGSVFAPVRWFHQDAIRIPMLALATVGAILDLAVLAWIRHLGSRSSAQWRKQEIGGREKRAERLQLALAALTLVLVGLEIWTHSVVVHRAHSDAAIQTNLAIRG